VVADVMAAVVAATVVVAPLPRAAGVVVARAVDLVVAASVQLAAVAVDLQAVVIVRLAAMAGITAAGVTAELVTTEIATAVDNLVSMATAPPVAVVIGRLVTTDSTEAVSTNTATAMVVCNVQQVRVITQPTAATARLALARTINGSSTVVAMAVQASSPADSVAAVPPDSVIAPAVVVPAGADNGSQAPSLVLQAQPRRLGRVVWIAYAEPRRLGRVGSLRDGLCKPSA